VAMPTAASLVEVLIQYRLLETTQLTELTRLHARFPAPKALAKELLNRGWLTAYQANQLLKGRGPDLILGAYVLLERLGEGGMGEVFKARHQRLGRIVALKLIRKERLSHPTAVRRFHHEIRAAAQLSHPNVVHAYDADQAGDIHFFTMEYVEGTDLAKLVRQRGPLPVPQACDYVRQAALGLQHAYERGLIHRDIKPANLLLSTAGNVLKILDLGLARQQQTDDGESGSTLTQDGAVMGTVDYLAPEQAINSHTVDIRADLYSLGCTFYHLLTGRVPFPGGEPLERLMRHQVKEAEALEKLRPETPPAVTAVVRKLMAKRPEDRFQTPGELAAALVGVLDPGAEPVSTPPAGSQTQVLSPSGEAAVPPTASPWADLMVPTTVDLATVSSRDQLPAVSRRRWVLFGAGGLAAAALLVLGLVFQPFGRHEPPPEDPRPAPVPRKPPPRPSEAQMEAAWLKQIAGLSAEEQVRAVVKKLQERNPGFDGKVTHRVIRGVVTDFHFVSDQVADISPVRALARLKILSCGGTPAKAPQKGKLYDLSPLQGLPLSNLSCDHTHVEDLGPLKGMPLVTLSCAATRVADLSPLKGMPLTILICSTTPVADLTPLKGMKLTTLNCGWTKVAGLTPLKDMKLTSLNCGTTPVADLTPLKGMKLTSLSCGNTQVSDLTLLRGMPLKEIGCDFNPFRDAAILRSIKTLARINSKPAQAFWKEMDARRAAHTAWCKQVAALPAATQAAAVAARLKSLNPNFDGKVTHQVEGRVVAELKFHTDHVKDLSPVQALAGLKRLECTGSAAGKGALVDLWPLHGLPLHSLNFSNTKVRDLGPLGGMPLTALWCNYTQVVNLTPLKGRRLVMLGCAGTHVSNLSPLTGMPLANLNCSQTQVANLMVLKGLPLKILAVNGTRVADLAPLKEMPLTALSCAQTVVSSLAPLAGKRLTFLNCGATRVADLSPLKGMPLKTLFCNANSQLTSLAPLRGMSLVQLHCDATAVTDLSPLQGMPLRVLKCNFKPERDAPLLRSLKTLQTINDKPAPKFWQGVDARPPARKP
jgi:serine/threonine protein kinase/Leucine-rich repeat (LRR) protein